MKLEDQVCSLELAKRLEDLGVPQKSLFYWDWISPTCYAVKFTPISCPYLERYSAFTVGELGEMLPRSIIIRKIELSDSTNGWLVECAHNEILAGLQIDKKLADALAKMFIHLSETHKSIFFY